MKRFFLGLLILVAFALFAYRVWCAGGVCGWMPTPVAQHVDVHSVQASQDEADCAPIWKKVAALPAAPATSTALVQTRRTKSYGCVSAHGLPDPACTPGAVFTGVGPDQICVKGYAASARNVPLDRWNAAFLEYGVTQHTSSAYEVDHLVPLELGGSNEIANLWPEPARPVPGFHEKDVVENCLHVFVCDGKMGLGEAQAIFAKDWKTVWP